MTKKHKLYFYFWKIYQRLKGFKVGTIVKIYSQEKNKYIKGCVTSISGDSITDNKYDFYFGINLFEPIQGNDLTSPPSGDFKQNRKITIKRSDRTRFPLHKKLSPLVREIS